MNVDIINNNKCLYCNRKIINFTSSFDWNNRKYHKVCIKKIDNNYINEQEYNKKHDEEQEIINNLIKWGHSQKEANEKMKLILYTKFT
jgi:hypothetical protein